MKRISLLTVGFLCASALLVLVLMKKDNKQQSTAVQAVQQVQVTQVERTDTVRDESPVQSPAVATNNMMQVKIAGLHLN